MWHYISLAALLLANKQFNKSELIWSGNAWIVRVRDQLKLESQGTAVRFQEGTEILFHGVLKDPYTHQPYYL
jgi:hypothetical protein